MTERMIPEEKVRELLRGDYSELDRLIDTDPLAIRDRLQALLSEALPVGDGETQHQAYRCPYDGGWCMGCGKPFEESLQEVSSEDRPQESG